MAFSTSRIMFGIVADKVERFIEDMVHYKSRVLVVYTVARRHYGVKLELVVKTRKPCHTLSYNLVRIRTYIHLAIVSTVLENTSKLVADYITAIEADSDSD